MADAVIDVTVAFDDRLRQLLQELLLQSGRASPAKKILIHRAAAMATACEAAEAAMAIGKVVDMGNYVRMVTALKQLLEHDGLNLDGSDFGPVIEVNPNQDRRALARNLAFAVSDARAKGQLHLLDPGLLDLVTSVTPEDIIAEDVPIASNDNPVEAFE